MSKREAMPMRDGVTEQSGIDLNDSKVPSRETKRQPAWKALAFALGVGMISCTPETQSQDKIAHKHALTDEALSKTFSPTFTELRVVDEDRDFIYFQVSRLKFIKVPNSLVNGKWLDQLFSRWTHALEGVKTKEEKDRVNEFHREKIEYELNQMGGTLVE